MPRYDYECDECGEIFEARHGFDDPAPPCPNGHSEVHKRITSVPRLLGGIMTDAGHGGTATKEELRSKWAEETPKLRKKLVDKLGEEAVNKYAPSLNHKYDD
ncbi:MAG: zinc ribbon domain-containing protein [Chloroflexi bacterium]|nr:MAG: zinc ribbon domain-containing protein [Chloroflexota bacterium]